MWWRSSNTVNGCVAFTNGCVALTFGFLGRPLWFLTAAIWFTTGWAPTLWVRYERRRGWRQD